MKVAVIGASGHIGSVIVQEAVGRGHEVTAVSRQQGVAQPAARVVQADARKVEDVARLAADHDVLVVSVSARKEGDAPIPDVVRTVVAGIASRAVRLFVVGGAGSLEVTPGVQLIDTPQFPEMYKSEALQQREVLAFLPTTGLDWTYLSPALEIAPGNRTAKFRLGENRLLTDEQGRSFISVEDYAVAVLDELERSQHVQKRFTVAY